MFAEWDEPGPYEIIETQDTTYYRCETPDYSLLGLIEGKCTEPDCEDCGRGSSEGVSCGWAFVHQAQNSKEGSNAASHPRVRSPTE